MIFDPRTIRFVLKNTFVSEKNSVFFKFNNNITWKIAFSFWLTLFLETDCKNLLARKVLFFGPNNSLLTFEKQENVLKNLTFGDPVDFEAAIIFKEDFFIRNTCSEIREKGYKIILNLNF